MKTIVLKRGKEESLLRFHPWVFSGAIARLPEQLEEGEVVKVEASDGRFLGYGHYEIGSIAVRMLTADAEDKIDEEFYRTRLSQAYQLRKVLGLARPDNNAYRLVHGEGDFLPGCVVDIYGPTAVLQAHSPGMHYARNIIANALVSLPDACIRNVYYKSETTLPYKARLDPVNDYIIGSYEGNIA
ncbi:MAG: class I SAM-dependent rRNA methyltransferase, partial [Duncaniella sp.]|nr:class I SAM-dependent rRNA methyltransferase [Duncaniella sp.]